MEKVLTYIDIFGFDMRIYIQGKTKNKTPFGGVLAIITIILIITMTYSIKKTQV